MEKVFYKQLLQFAVGILLYHVARDADPYSHLTTLQVLLDTITRILSLTKNYAGPQWGSTCVYGTRHMCTCHTTHKDKDDGNLVPIDKTAPCNCNCRTLAALYTACCKWIMAEPS